MKQLKDLVDPIERRRGEASKRPREIELLRDLLNQTKAFADVIAEQAEKSAGGASSVESSVPTSTTDDFADLEDSTTSSSSTSTSSSPSGTPELPEYTAEDVSSLTGAYKSVHEWLEAKLIEQDKLSPHDDPVILSEDIAAKAKELSRAVTEILQKRIRVPPKAKSSSKTKTKTNKAKGGSGKSGTSLTASTAREEATKRSQGGDSGSEENSKKDSTKKAKGSRKDNHDEL